MLSPQTLLHRHLPAVLLVALQLATAALLGSAVICEGRDGHVAWEAVDADGSCGPGSPVAGLTTAGHCGLCTDSSPIGAWLTNHVKRQHLQVPGPSPLPSVAPPAVTAGLLPGVAPVTARPAPPPLASLPHDARQGVVLRI